MAKESDRPRSNAQPGPWRPWLHWRFKRFWVLVAAVVYTLAGFFLLPWIVERILVGTFADVERTATVTEVRTNPYLLTLELEGFELMDRDGERLLLFDRLFVNLQASSLFRWAWTFKMIQLVGLHPFEERFEGSDTRFLRLLTDLADTGEVQEPEEQDLPPRAIIQRLEVVEARLTVTDRPTANYRAELGPIAVEVDDVRTVPDHTGRQSVVIEINESDLIEWQGDLQLVPFHSRGELTVRGRDFPETLRYLDHYLPFDPEFEQLDLSLSYDAALVEAGLSLRLGAITAGVDGLTLTLDEGGPPVVSVAEIDASGGTLDLLARSMALEDLAIRSPAVTAARREDGSLSLLDLIPERPAGQSPDTPGGATDTPWTVRLDRFTLEDGRADLEDRTTEPTLSLGLADISTELSGMDLADGTVMPVRLAARLDSGGTVGYEGVVTVFPSPSSTGRLEFDSVALAVAQPYVNPFMRITVEGGLLGMSGDLVHGPEQPLALTGQLEILDFALQDGARDERLVAWNALQLDRFEVDLAGNRADTSVLEFEGLYGRLHIAEDLSTNIGDLLVESPGDEEGAGDAASEVSMPALTIGGVALTAAALDFSDFSLPLPFEAEIRSLEGDISTLSTESDEPATVALEGQVNEYGLARIDGALNAWDPTAQTDITMVFRNLEIARLTPYTIQFAGYAIEAGRLDMDLGYVLEQRQLQGQNNIVIREIQLGEKVDHPDAGSLPLGLAIALLKDSEGVIDIDLPVEGDLDNPEFRIGGVIWRAIGNLITRAVTAPFRLLGNLVGVDSEDFGVMAFAPGRSDVLPPDREKLVKLGEAMLERPELVVEVAGTWAGEQDRRALQEALVRERMEGWLEANPGDGDELSTARDRQALEALFTESLPSEPLAGVRASFSAPPEEDPEGEPVLDETAYTAALRSRLTEATEISTDRLETLARARAQAVIATLQESQPEAELMVREAEPVETEATEDGTTPLELAVSAEG